MNYLALTIGPIIETLSNSKKTKELFAGSYLFSYIMKSILKELESKKYDLIVPHHDNIDKIFNGKYGIGMFHDRLIVSSNKTETQIEDDINSIIDYIINEITKKIIEIDKRNKKFEDKIKEFFKNYLQISYVITPNFSLEEIMNLLDVAELNREFIINPDDYKILIDQEGNRVNPLIYLQRKFHKSFLKDDAFEDKKTDFPSTLEIALNKDIEYTYNEKEDEQLENEALKGAKQYQKYFAIIQGDGDKIGSILSEIDKDSKQIKEFSKKLLEYTQKIPEIAKKYDAKVVYAGGDDMLAFAPLLSEGGTIFDFLKALDDEFKKTIKTLDLEQAKDVSLSFGVAIVYHKKPLYQALNKAITNLFAKAKLKKDRNRIVAEIVKHSGQSFEVELKISDSTFKTFTEILEKELNLAKDDKKDGLPHSIVHNISRSQNLILSMANRFNDDVFNKRIESFFENNFNKEIHKNKTTKELLDKTRELLILDIKSQKEQEEKKSLNHFYSMLSAIKHLRGDR